MLISHIDSIPLEKLALHSLSVYPCPCRHGSILCRGIRPPENRCCLLFHCHYYNVHSDSESHGRAKAGRPARTYLHQLCEDTGCNPEGLLEAMNDREGWRERVRDICADGMTRLDDDVPVRILSMGQTNFFKKSLLLGRNICNCITVQKRIII